VGTILASGRTSLPSTEPKPPSSTKSRCMSMTISASLPAGKRYSYGWAATVGISYFPRWNGNVNEVGGSSRPTTPATASNASR
jgi:hypothetical protein